MNRFLTTAALALTIGMATIPAFARGFEPTCTIYDSQGSRMTYQFGENDADTLVEKSFQKGTKMVMSEVGHRPVWRVDDFGDNSYAFRSQANPGWSIYVDKLNNATLDHNGRTAGEGGCTEYVQQTADKGIE
jgi:hypothetical protein